jgi:hypothetical protein
MMMTVTSLGGEDLPGPARMTSQKHNKLYDINLLYRHLAQPSSQVSSASSSGG